MTATNLVNLIYLGKFADVDPHESTGLLLFKKPDYDAENAHDLEGVSRAAGDLSLVSAKLSDANHNGVIEDNENSHDYVQYTIGIHTFHNQTDSTLVATLRVTLSDGTVRNIDAVLIQQDNGDLFATDLLNHGTLDNLSIAQIDIADIKTADSNGWFSNQSVDNVTFAPVSTDPVTPPAGDGNGTVSGTAGDDLINGAYDGDPEGDRIDAGDAIAVGAGPNDDIVVAGAGDDTVLAGEGQDTVFGDGANGNERTTDGADTLFGGADDDTVYGQGGDDVIYGDGGGDVTVGGARESFEWSKAPTSHAQAFTQNTGSVNVSFSFHENDPHDVETSYSHDQQNVNGLDAGTSTTSSLKSLLDDDHDQGTYSLAFDAPVTDVTFNINDIDIGSRAKVQAFDANGNQIPVTIDGGFGLTLVDTDSVAGADTAKSNGGDQSPTADKYSATVTIPGPVSEIRIVHTQTGHDDSGIHITDVLFDGPAQTEAAGVDGDDLLFGGSGDDVIFGNGGDDSIFGGTGDDTISGDDGTAGTVAPGPVVRESFNWDLVTDAQIDSTVTQDTGEVSVTYTRTADTGLHESSLSSDMLNTSGINSGGETVDNNSSLASETMGHGNTGQFEWKFSELVENVSFNVNDIDGDGVVKIQAFDAAGNEIPVSLTAGNNLTLIGGNTADSNGGYQDDTSPDYNLNVNVPGPVSKIVLTHDQNGGDNSGINVTDIYFNAVPDMVGGNDPDAGDDMIDGGAGDDIIDGNGGDDSILGGSGDDVIRGDSGVQVAGPVEFTRESFEWDKVPDPSGDGTSIDDGDDLNGGFSQNTGNVTVDFFVSDTNETPVSTFETESVKVHSIAGDDQPLNGNSSLDSLLNVDGETATYNLDFSDNVQNVSFRIDDLDNASQVEIRAYDADGNLLPVDVQTGNGISASDQDGVDGDEFLQSNGGDGDELNPAYSALINIAGPVSRIEIDHTKVQALEPGSNAGINITDVYFDAPVDGTGTPVDAAEGDDIIDGGTGNDVIEGNGGQDFIDGGTGNDVIDAGAGDDVDESTAPASGARPADEYQNAYAGGAGDDIILGGVGDDIITGDDDSRVSDKTGEGFDANADGDDILFGGEGNDEIHVGTWADSEQDLGDTQTGMGSDTAFGGAGDDILIGDGGDDVLAGDEGDDRMVAGGGQDFVSGGEGNDTISAGNGDPDGTGGQAASGARPADEYDNAFAGGAGDDVLTGGAGDDIITGDDDSRVADRTGEAFNPEADGSDTIFGGAGDDEIHVGTWADGEQGLGDTQTGNAADTAFGGDGNDILVGDAGDDALSGDAGDDLIISGGGNDMIFGGDDADTIRATAGDTVDGGTGQTTGVDFDVLVIPDGQPFINAGPGGVGAPVLDPDGDSFTGQIIFTDGMGNPTGEVIDYTEIEEIRGGEPENEAPTAVADLLDAGEDDPAAVIGNVLDNDVDPNGDPLVVTEVNGVPGDVGQPVDLDEGGKVTIGPDGTVTFDPDGDFEELGEGEEATTTVTYTVDDGQGGTDTATVTITVTGTNDAPVAVMDMDTTDEDTAITLENVLGNDTDPEDDPLTVSEVNGTPANVGQPVAGDMGGLFTINPDGTASFDPNGEFDELADGEETVTTVSYTVTDPDGAESTTDVTVTVTGTNDGPVAVQDDLTAGEDDPNALIGNVLGNDTDPENDPLTVSEVNGDPAGVGTPIAGDNGGLVTIAPNGNVAFDPNDDFEGLGEGEEATTTVTYTVTDPDGLEDTATVTITVTGTNDQPVAVADTGVSTPDMVQPLDNVLGNDTDPDTNDVLTVSEVNGTPANVGQPVAGDNGGLVTINPDGTASFDPNGEFDDLAEGEEATTTVTYTVTDGNGGEDTTTVTITVTGTNGAPVAVADPLDAGEDDPAAVIGNVLDNDVDPNGDPLVVTEVNGVPGDVGQPVDLDEGGKVTIGPDGTVTFDPDGDFEELGEGEEATTTVTYTVDDGQGGTDTATVTITVTGTNDAPVAVMDMDTTDEDTAITLENVLGNDTDPEDDPLTVSEVNGTPSNVGQPVAGDMGGLFTINPDGTASFDPNGEFDELADGEETVTTVSYTITDPDGAESTTDVTVTVTGTNDGPVATDDQFNVDADEPAGDIDGNVITGDNGFGVDSDPESDPLTVIGVNAPTGNVGTPVAGDNGGLFTINADGTVDFDANGDFDDVGLNDVAETSVTYTISDGNGGTDTATVTFRVGGDSDGTIQGTAGNDIINPDIPYVDADGDIVDGNDAKLPGDVGNDDLILGFEGDDSIDAGDGNDEVFGGIGNDTIDGGVGDDTLSGDAGNDDIIGGEGDDTIDGGVGNDVLVGDDGNDDIFGNDGDDTILGGVGDDSIRGGDGEDTIAGGVGDDTINGGDDNDTIDGGAGNDVLDGNLGDDVVAGGDGDDTIQGGAGDDTLAGDDGDDSITGGVGNDSVTGGDGNDVINAGNHANPAADYDYPGAVIPGLPIGDNDQFPDNDLDVVDGGAGDDIITTGDDDDTIFGGLGNDTIDAGIDDDFVRGGAGNDTIIGSQGEDTLYGDAGNDLIYGGLENEVLNLPDAIDPAPDDNRDTIFGGDGDDTIFGRDDNDSIQGGDGNDLIFGGIDDDKINGGEGDDEIYGDQGNDSLDGKTGNDTIYGGEGDDFVGGGVGDGDDILYGDAGNDRMLGGEGNDTIYGGLGDDSISANDGDDTVFGDDGNDLIVGGEGDEEIFGGTGNDTIRSNAGNDVVDGGEGDDIILTGTSPVGQTPDKDYPGDGLAADPDPFDDIDTVFGGDGNDIIGTGDDADIIFGGDGDDDIDGGIDDDVISSGDGADLVKGGFGNDTFTDVSSGDVIIGGEDPDDGDIDRFNFDQATLDKIDRIETNGGAGDAEELRESGTIFFKDGTTATFEEIEAPCFTPGTLIATPKGERLVEDLRVGDKIITRDNGIQEIAWYGQQEVTGKELAAKPHMKPILVKAGSLGHGLPERDMMLSPNHRLLVSSEKTQLYFEEREVLAAAKHMVGAQGIHTLDVMRTTYIHFMFEQHEVVLSNGAWTESFHPGDYSLNGLGNSQRNEIFELFPELKTDAGLQGYQSARKALKKHEAKLLMK